VFERWKEAIANFNEAVRNNPSDPNGYFNRGLAYYDSGRYSEALEDFDKAFKLNLEFTDALYHRGLAKQALQPEAKTNLDLDRAFSLFWEQGSTHYAAGRNVEAIANYSKAAKIYPYHGRIYYQRGLACYKARFYEEALRDFNEAIRLEPVYADAFYQRSLVNEALGKHDGVRRDRDREQAFYLFAQQGNTHYAAGRYREAIDNYNKAVEINSEIAEIYYDLGSAYFKSREYDKALADFDRAIKLNTAYANAFCQRSLVKKALGDNEGARKDWVRAPFLFLQEGINRYAAGRYEEAIDSYNKAAEINPRVADVYYNRGLAYFMLRKSDGALRDFNEAIRLEPVYADAFYQRSSVKKAQGNHDGAREDREKAFSLFLQEGKNRYAVGCYEEAIDNYNKAVEINPRADIYYNRGLAYCRSRKSKCYEALADFDKAIELNSGYTDAFYQRGETYRFLRNYDKAMVDFDKVISLSPTHADAFNSRGLVKEALKQQQQADQDYKEALRLKPEFYYDVFSKRGIISRLNSSTQSLFSSDFQQIQTTTTLSNVTSYMPPQSQSKHQLPDNHCGAGLPATQVPRSSVNTHQNNSTTFSQADYDLRTQTSRVLPNTTTATTYSINKQSPFKVRFQRSPDDFYRIIQRHEEQRKMKMASASGSGADVNQLEIERNKPLNLEQLFNDEDINILIDLHLYRQNGCNYRLINPETGNEIFPEANTSTNYNVFVTPAVDSWSYATPIGFYLDKDLRQPPGSNHSNQEYIHRFLSGCKLQIVGLSHEDIPGDGHCLFNAVALYLEQTQELLRQDVATHLECNLSEVRHFIQLSEGKNAEDYINDVRNGIEWASHVEIEVLMRLLGRPIMVVGPDSKIVNVNDAHRRGEPIFVYYNGHNHYDALILTGEKEARAILNDLLLSQTTVSQQPLTHVSERSLNQTDNRRDVFDEMGDLLSRETAAIKILFPYKLDPARWLTGEIRIYKEKYNCVITLYTHDPCGGGQISEDNRFTLEKVISKRIREIVDNRALLYFYYYLSPYTSRRQAEDDTASYGAIVVRDIIERIQGKNLPSYKYAKGAKELREQYIRAVSINESDPLCIKFIERHTLNAPLPPEPQTVFNKNQLANLSDLMECSSVDDPIKKEMIWVKNLDVAYGDKLDERCFTIESHQHTDLRGDIVKASKEFKDGDKQNFLRAKIGFLFSKLSQGRSDSFRFESFELKGVQEFIHVSTEYDLENNPEELVEDIKKNDSIKTINNASGWSFFVNYHHSERALFKFLTNQHNLEELAMSLANKICMEHKVPMRECKIKAVILDICSTHYLCNKCLPAMHNFQEYNSSFSKLLTSILKSLDFNFSKTKEGLYILTRYSAELPAHQQSAKSEEEHMAENLIIDIKSKRKKKQNLILARDNTVTQDDLSPHSFFTSRKPENIKRQTSAYSDNSSFQSSSTSDHMDI
jgi:tetratricopeptide (TPR) repeat protein